VAAGAWRAAAPVTLFSMPASGMPSGTHEKKAYSLCSRSDHCGIQTNSQSANSEQRALYPRITRHRHRLCFRETIPAALSLQ
jgi:hypothetical protein